MVKLIEFNYYPTKIKNEYKEFDSLLFNKKGWIVILPLETKTIFKLYEYPNIRESYLVCDDCDIENFTIKSFGNSQSFSRYDDAFKYVVLDVVNEETTDTAIEILSNFDEEEKEEIINDDNDNSNKQQIPFIDSTNKNNGPKR